MGFTFSHPALILPFKQLPKKYYSLSGLIIGSMVPDFEYFLRWSTISSFSHTWRGIFILDIPLSLLILFFFHKIARNYLINNSPGFIKSRCINYLEFDWQNYFSKNWLVVICSIFIGVCTHFIWDSFSAGNGYFVRHIAFLTKETEIGGLTIMNYLILKHFSSLVGILIIGLSIIKIPKEKYKNTGNKYYWLIILLFFLLGIIAYSFRNSTLSSLNLFIKRVISSAIYSIIIVSTAYKIAEQRKLNADKL